MEAVVEEFLLIIDDNNKDKFSQMLDEHEVCAYDFIEYTLKTKNKVMLMCRSYKLKILLYICLDAIFYKYNRIKMSRKLNAKEMAEREEFEQVEELFDMLIELYDPIKCKSVYNGMLAASQVQFLNYCKDMDNIYTFYAYL